MTTVTTLLQLQDELRQFAREELSLGFKYTLEVYMEKLRTLVKPAETQRDELIKRLSNGTNNIPGELEGKPNPAHAEFVKLWGEVLGTEAELPEKPLSIPLTLLEGIKSTHTYPLIFKHFVTEA
jgi:hypothetical protein